MYVLLQEFTLVTVQSSDVYYFGTVFGLGLWYRNHQIEYMYQYPSPWKHAVHQYLQTHWYDKRKVTRFTAPRTSAFKQTSGETSSALDSTLKCVTSTSQVHLILAWNLLSIASPYKINQLLILKCAYLLVKYHVILYIVHTRKMTMTAITCRLCMQFYAFIIYRHQTPTFPSNRMLLGIGCVDHEVITFLINPTKMSTI